MKNMEEYFCARCGTSWQIDFDGEVPVTISHLCPQCLDENILQLAGIRQTIMATLADLAAAIENDERLGYPTATIEVNAPLALIQLQLNTRLALIKELQLKLLELT